MARYSPDVGQDGWVNASGRRSEESTANTLGFKTDEQEIQNKTLFVGLDIFLWLVKNIKIKEIKMKNQEITVFYKWTANPGKLDELKAIYQEVYKAMKENEPDSLKMECYFADEENAIIVHDVFKDGAALGFHLGGTAAHHFPKLAEIAIPGPFFFCGDVPEELRQAAEGMNMGAEFSTHAFGFDRRSS